MRTTAALLLLAAGCAHSAGPAPGTAERLVGTWRLASVVAVRSDGSTTVSKWGKSPAGYLVYDRSGHMAAQIMGDPRPVFRDPEHPTPDEARAALKSYLAYAGTYTFDLATGVVTHNLELSADPSEVGQRLPRQVESVGEQIVLLAQPYTGEQVRNRLTWVRVSGP